MANTITNTDAHTTGRKVFTTTETKPSYKTTEFALYLLAVIGVLIASAVTDNGSDGQGFSAERAWFFVTLLTMAYLVSRGLAKSGSYEKEHHDADDAHSGR
jgi:hypothetical protein